MVSASFLLEEGASWVLVVGTTVKIIYYMIVALRGDAVFGVVGASERIDEFKHVREVPRLGLCCCRHETAESVVLRLYACRMNGWRVMAVKALGELVSAASR